MLEVTGIDAFYGKVQALWDVTFRVAKGEIVTIIGANGAGKSTTLKTISGLLKPRRGQIVFEGADVTGLAPNRLVEPFNRRVHRDTSQQLLRRLRNRC